VELELPERLEAAIDPSATHDLMLGVAIRVGGRFLKVAAAERHGVTTDNGKAELRARLTIGSADQEFGIEATFEANAMR
jgi:hypothetical protein